MQTIYREKEVMSRQNANGLPHLDHLVVVSLVARPLKESITLLAEEVEALYLMDLLELYQKKRRLKWEVSRPTFARIIKSARHKVELAFLGGHTLHLESHKERYVVAVCSESEVSPYTELSPKSRYIHFSHWKAIR